MEAEALARGEQPTSTSTSSTTATTGDKRSAGMAGLTEQESTDAMARSRPRQRLDVTAADDIKMQRRRQVLAAIREDLGEPQAQTQAVDSSSTTTSGTATTSSISASTNTSSASPASGEEGKVAIKLGLKFTGSTTTASKPKANGTMSPYNLYSP